MRQSPHDVYVPTRWVDEDALFVGRENEIKKIKRALKSAGNNIVIFGPRGLGKTTIARHIEKELEENVVWIDCDSGIRHGDLVVRLFNKLNIRRVENSKIETDQDNIRVSGKFLFLGASSGQKSEDKEISKPFSDAINSVDYVCDRLQELERPTLVILDEFDLISRSPDSKKTLKFLVELIKAVAGRGKNFVFRFMFVGVGESVTSLMGEHESIHRNIQEIQVKKIPNEYIELFLHNAQEMTQLYFERSVQKHFIEQADGFPYFVHLIGLACCQICEELNSNLINFDIYEKAFNDCFSDHFRANKKRFSDNDRNLNEIDKAVIFMLAQERQPIISFRNCFNKYGDFVCSKFSSTNYEKLKSSAERLSKANYMIYRISDSEKFGFIDPIMKVFLRERFYLTLRKGFNVDRTRRQLEFYDDEIRAEDL